ncbi:GtrA family protein [Acinetobacter ursingii]|uniref:GtrA family protein n=1 Tax=Acinetobacter ursingii TaxID=108980 RepID=UPI00374D93A2|nr:GtrA family protein [Acinetobacter ursingii]
MLNFFKYNFIGIFNSSIHWLSYLVCTYYLAFSSMTSNLISFFLAASTSYILNSKFNYHTQMTKSRYFKFLLIMGTLSYTIALTFYLLEINNIIMLISYTLISILFGFFLTKNWVFEK